MASPAGSGWSGIHAGRRARVGASRLECLTAWLGSRFVLGCVLRRHGSDLPRQHRSSNEAYQADHCKSRHGESVGALRCSGDAGNKDGAGDSGSEAGAEVGHAAGQAGDLTLQVVREAGLHDIDRRGKHQAEAEANEEQTWGEGPGGRRNPDDQQQDTNACDRENESGKDEGPLGKPLSETFCGKCLPPGIINAAITNKKIVIAIWMP